MPATLIIECSTPKATIALSEGDVVMQREFISDRNHNAMLFEPLQQLLDGRSDIERVLVGSGPGSYSGTRVGIAAAQGVGLALGCPVIAVPSILAVAAADDGASCLAIGDARRDSYWFAMVTSGRLEQEPLLCDLNELTQAIGRAVSRNAGIFAFESADRFPLAENLQSAIRLEFPDATRLWRVWQESGADQQAAWQAEVAQPIYLKPPHITPGKRQSLIQ